MKRIVIVLASVLLVVGLGFYVRQVIRETVESRVPGRQYLVSLGDSVAAGAGLSDAGGRRLADCDLSEKASPFLLGQQLHESVEQFACSGATVAAMAQSSSSLLNTQYPAAKPFLAQSDVVVYAGANDIGWLQTLTSCVRTNCATAESRTLLTSKLRALQVNLGTLLVQLEQAHPRRVVVNTYYSLLAPSDTCFARFGITPPEVGFINDEEAQLNAVITAAAAKANATVVAVDFSGHSLCSSRPWIQGVSAEAPLHPTVVGQQQIAKQDARAFMAALQP